MRTRRDQLISAVLLHGTAEEEGGKEWKEKAGEGWRNSSSSLMGGSKVCDEHLAVPRPAMPHDAGRHRCWLMVPIRPPNLTLPSLKDKYGLDVGARSFHTMTSKSGREFQGGGGLLFSRRAAR